MKRVLALCCVLAIVPTVVMAEVDGAEILRKVDDMWRGESSATLMSMRIKTQHFERSLTMKGYSKGTDLSLVRIVRPKQEAGTATLKVENNIWNYLPKTRRVMKIPSSMMMGSWMGSHFTNDDLVRESRLEVDYSFEIEETEDEDGRKIYRLTLIPRPEAPVVWGKIVVEVIGGIWVPTWEEWYDEEGALVRRAVFERVETFGDRHVPMVMRIEPTDKPGEFTEITYDKLLFDVDLDENFFSIQNLKRSSW